MEILKKRRCACAFAEHRERDQMSTRQFTAVALPSARRCTAWSTSNIHQSLHRALVARQTRVGTVQKIWALGVGLSRAHCLLLHSCYSSLIMMLGIRALPARAQSIRGGSDGRAASPRSVVASSTCKLLPVLGSVPARVGHTCGFVFSDCRRCACLSATEKTGPLLGWAF